MLNFLTDGVIVNATNSLNIPRVTTQQMTSKVNGITGQFYTFINGTILNIVVIVFLIAILSLIFYSVFSKKHLGKAVIGLACVLIGLIIFKEAPEIIGWVSTLAN